MMNSQPHDVPVERNLGRAGVAVLLGLLIALVLCLIVAFVVLSGPHTAVNESQAAFQTVIAIGGLCSGLVGAAIVSLVTRGTASARAAMLGYACLLAATAGPLMYAVATAEYG